MKHTKLFFSILLSILLATCVSAADLGDYWGVPTIDGQVANGKTVTAYKNGALVDSTVVGEDKEGFYLVHVDGKAGDTVTLKINGQTAYTTDWTSGDHYVNISATTPTSNNGGGSSGGGSSGGTTRRSSGGGSSIPVCTPNWNCTEWTDCAVNSQTCLAAEDTNNCGKTFTETIYQECEMPASNPKDPSESGSGELEVEEAQVNDNPEEEVTEPIVEEDEPGNALTGNVIAFLQGNGAEFLKKSWIPIAIIAFCALVVMTNSKGLRRQARRIKRRMR